MSSKQHDDIPDEVLRQRALNIRAKIVRNEYDAHLNTTEQVSLEKILDQWLAGGAAPKPS